MPALQLPLPERLRVEADLNSRTLLFRVGAETEWQLRRAFGTNPGQFCRTDSDLVNRISGEEPYAVVLDTSACAGGTFIGAAVLDAISGRKVLLRTELAPGGARQVVAVSRRTSDWQVSFIGCDDLTLQLRKLVSDPTNQGAGRTILAAALPVCDHTVHDLLAVAILRGDRRVPVGSFAILCGLPVRTLQARLHRCGGPAARDLLGWSLTLHACWRLEISGWPAKQVAAAAGFAQASALGEFLKRHVNARPRALQTPGSFSWLLHRFGELFRCAAEA